MNCFVNPSYKELKKKFFDTKLKTDIEETVSKIIEKVSTNGDQALREYTLKFDNIDLSGKPLQVDKKEAQLALDKLDENLLSALKQSKKNIIDYHKNQLRPDITLDAGLNSYIKEISMPVQTAGCYIPGGTAPLVSSVLMTALPAKAAGVEKIVVVTPVNKEGSVNKAILAACELCGVDEIYKIGGAQAIAALAYGTESIPQVNVIAGPGNAYVTEAKRQVFGQVGIDMVAGPSNVLILTDKRSDPDYVAIDLLAQLEHGKDSTAICISTSKDFLGNLKNSLDKLLQNSTRQNILTISAEKGLFLIEVDDNQKMVNLANDIAAEHLEIMTETPEIFVSEIKNAGAVFIGKYTPEAVGDYFAGPSHVLPTGGNAKFFYGLSVYHFLKKISIIKYSKEKLVSASGSISIIAETEGLDAHNKSVMLRCKGNE